MVFDEELESIDAHVRKLNALWPTLDSEKRAKLVDVATYVAALEILTHRDRTDPLYAREIAFAKHTIGRRGPEYDVIDTRHVRDLGAVAYWHLFGDNP